MGDTWQALAERGAEMSDTMPGRVTGADSEASDKTSRALLLPPEQVKRHPDVKPPRPSERPGQRSRQVVMRATPVTAGCCTRENKMKLLIK